MLSDLWTTSWCHAYLEGICAIDPHRWILNSLFFLFSFTLQSFQLRTSRWYIPFVLSSTLFISFICLFLSLSKCSDTSFCSCVLLGSAFLAGWTRTSRNSKPLAAHYARLEDQPAPLSEPGHSGPKLTQSTQACDNFIKHRSREHDKGYQRYLKLLAEKHSSRPTIFLTRSLFEDWPYFRKCQYHQRLTR